jgi:DNA-binding beta-propeller fold protein YncE
MKWLAAGALLVLVGVAGCGSQYRPVINPVTPTGPASQPTANVVVISQPGFTAVDPTSTAGPCVRQASPNQGSFAPYSSPANVTVVDFSGDTIMATAQLGNGPLGFALDAAGVNAYTLNCDNTISSIPISTSLQTKNVNSSTLFQGSFPINALAISSKQYVVEQGTNKIAALTGTPPVLQQEINVPSSVINVTGISASQRVYAISQGNSGANGTLAWGQCANPSPSNVSVNGEADGIEVATNSISSQLPLGVCPVYGVTSADGLRTFILNRGSGTVSVINAQQNTLDTLPNPNFNNQSNSNLGTNATINLCPGTTGACNAQPVFAELYTTGNRLVVSNYGNNTVSVIDVSLDIYGNDSATFGKVVGTINVGSKPVELTILQDGSKIYTANSGDGTVTVGSLTSFQPLSTITIGGNPRTIDSIYNYPEGKVYVTSPNSQAVTVIRTDTDVISATVAIQGNVVDLHTQTQYAAASTVATGSSTAQNGNTQSYSSGSGVP